MMIIDTWKLKLFLASTLGAQLQAIIFSISRSDGFLADRDLWKVLCQFICVENSTIYYTVTSLGQSFKCLFSLVEPVCLQFVLMWNLSQLNYSHSVPQSENLLSGISLRRTRNILFTAIITGKISDQISSLSLPSSKLLLWLPRPANT